MITTKKKLNNSKITVENKNTEEILIRCGIIAFCFSLVVWFFFIGKMHSSFLDRRVTPSINVISEAMASKDEGNSQDEHKTNSEKKITQSNDGENSQDEHKTNSEMKITQSNDGENSQDVHKTNSEIGIEQFYESFISLLITFCTLFVGGATIIFVLLSAISFVSATNAYKKTRDAEKKYNDIVKKYNRADKMFKKMNKNFEKLDNDMKKQKRTIFHNEKDDLFSFFPSMWYTREIFKEWEKKRDVHRNYVCDEFFSEIITNLLDKKNIDDPLLLSMATKIYLNKSDKMDCPVILSIAGLSRQLLVNRISDNKEKIQHLFAAKSYYTRAIEALNAKIASVDLLPYVQTNNGAVLVKLAALCRKDKSHAILIEIDNLYSQILLKESPTKQNRFIAYNAFNFGMSFLFQYVNSARFSKTEYSNIKEFADNALRYFEYANMNMNHIATYSIACLHSEENTRQSFSKSITILEDFVSFIKENIFDNAHKKAIKHIFRSIHPDVFYNDMLIDKVRAARENEFLDIAASYCNSYTTFNKQADG